MTKASTWNDYRKAGAACTAIEQRLGLEPVPGRITGRTVPEPSRKDLEISAARGEPEPLRTRLERKVRACAAAARTEAQFVALARANGLLIRPRYSNSGTVTGYAVADPTSRHARDKRTGTTGPIWFGGGKLASDLTLPSLRRRWEPHRTEALAAWSAATSLPPRTLSHDTPLADADPAAVAGLLAAAATGCEPATPGPLSKAARLMAKAAQLHPAPSRSPQTAAILSDMASTFLAITATSNSGVVLALMTEVAALVDACDARAQATATARQATQQASAMVHTSLATLTRAAHRQARSALTAAGTAREVTMTELTHEEEFLTHLTAGGVLAARLIRARSGLPLNEPPDVRALKKAGYNEHTPYDEHLRRELGERRWAWYVKDPARVVCAKMITDGTAAGHDMTALLTRVAVKRAWEDDQHSPARSIARVLAYRLQRELEKPPSRRTAAFPPSRPLATRPGLTTVGSSPGPMPSTPWDDHIRDLLGTSRWERYARDERRRDVAEALAKAHTDGHDIPRLLTRAVTCREWEDDPQSPARRIAGVLHHRIKAAIASGEFATGRSDAELPADVATAVVNATAPRSGHDDAARHAADTGVPGVPRTIREAPGRDRD